MGVVALRQVEGDDSVQVAGDDLPVSAGEQIECETAGTVAYLDRQLSSSSPKSSLRLAASATQYWASPTVSSSAGRVLVKVQLKHRPVVEVGSAIQLHPQRLRFAQMG